jgi:hypothetical protein
MEILILSNNIRVKKGEMKMKIIIYSSNNNKFRVRVLFKVRMVIRFNKENNNNFRKKR